MNDNDALANRIVRQSTPKQKKKVTKAISGRMHYTQLVELTVPISANIRAELKLPGQITLEEYDRFIQTLELWKGAIVSM